MEDPQSTSDVPQVSFKKRSKPKSSFRKRAATPPPADDSSSGYSSSDGEERRIKRRKKTAGMVTGSSNNATAAETSDSAKPDFVDRSTTISSTNDATKQSNWYDEDDLGAKNLLGTTRDRPATEGNQTDGTYKGATSYQSFMNKNPNAPTKQVGPVKAPTNIRTITVTDFAPDVCKDYKQTGWCGFGDSCKFLHARENYKQGWELDKDWEIGTKGKNITGKTVASANRGAKADLEDDDDDDEALLESIPFACVICKKPYTNPIVTRCGHYYCESCALGRYRKNPSCAACGAGTGGVFNMAKKLGKLLERKRERARQRREKARENGEEVNSESEDEEE